MMSAPAALALRNLTGRPLRLHFRCDGRSAWEAWAEAGGELQVPAALPSTLLASASHVDPRTQVVYTLKPNPALPGTRLVATVRELARARSFGCMVEAGSAPQLLELSNRTAGNVCFVLTYTGTPFVVTCPVLPGETLCLQPHRFDLSATLNGVSCAAMAIAGWPALVEVAARNLHGIESPQFLLPAGGVDAGA